MPFTDRAQQRDLPLFPITTNQQFTTLATSSSIYVPIFVSWPALVAGSVERLKSFWFEGMSVSCSLSAGTINASSGTLVYSYIAPTTWGDALASAASTPTLANATYATSGVALAAENTIYEVGRNPTAGFVSNRDANLILPGSALFLRLANATGGNITGNLAITAWIRGRQGQ
jgi:hypothetical protein